MSMNIEGVVKGLVIGIIGLVLVFILVANLAPTLTESLTNMSNSGLPLAGLFSPTGIVAIVIVAGILIGSIALGLKLFRGK